MATAAEFCRVSIRTADAEVDLALPADIPIGELLPAAIDLITGDNTALSPDVGGDTEPRTPWRRRELQPPGSQP